MKKIVTIAVPVYGVENYIERCARSLFGQTYNDIDFIFIDDCTPDKSFDVLQRVLQDYPEREANVKIIRHDRNRGLAAARNTGIDHAKGEFVLWVDSDDYIEKNTVEECIKKQVEGDYDLVLFDCIKHLPKKDLPKRSVDFADPLDLTKKLLDGSMMHGVWSGLIRKTLYTNNNIRTIEGVNQGEDYMTLPKLAYCAKRVSQIHQYFYHYNMINPNSYSNTFSRKRSENQITVYENLIDYFKEEESLSYILHRRYIKSINTHVKHGMRDGDYQYYKLSLERLKNLDNNYIKYLSFGDQLFYYLQFDSLRKIYIKIAYYLKNK